MSDLGVDKSVTGQTAYLGLGSNMGDREGYLAEALQLLDSYQGVKIVATSSLYESEPVGYLDQGWFINQVVALGTTLSPLELLRAIQGVENTLGRKRLIRWGPRVIDVDLLLYGGQFINLPQLTVPHPRMYQRNFVLLPLNEIAPDLVHPDGQTTAGHCQEYLETGHQEGIRPWTGETSVRN